MLTAMLPVSVGNEGLNGLTLLLQPGLTIARRVVIDGSARPLPDGARVVIALRPRTDLR